MTWARGLCIRTTCITLPRAIQIPLFLSGVRRVENALIDSGATDNFLTPTLAKRLGLAVQKLKIPKPMLTVDGSPHKQGSITEYTDLILKVGSQRRKQRFYLATLGQDRAILGFPFLQKFNPTVNWSNATIKGVKTVEIETESKKASLLRVLLFQNEARKKCGEPQEGEGLYCTIRRVSFAQQWASAADNKEKMTSSTIPEEYQRHWKVFDEECAKRFPPSRKENMSIKFLPNVPEGIDCKVYPLNQRELETLRKYLSEELAKGFIEDGCSPYTSPTFYIPKKDKGEYQLVVDYRKLNEITERDYYPMPNVQVELDKLKGMGLFTKFDVRAGYNNILIEPEDAHKAAFKTPLGTYVPKVMTFGLTNAPSVFQRSMYRDMRPLFLKYPENIANLMDDFAIATHDTPEGRILHREIVHFFLDLMELHSYFLKPSKCVFEKDQIDFLGFQIRAGSARIDPTKIDGIRDWPEDLHSKKEVRQFLGVIGYQRPFIRDFAKKAIGITKLLKDTPWIWGDDQRNAVRTLKQAVCDDPELVAPDLTKAFELETDASAFALVATLFQKDNRGKNHMIGATARTLTETERNYDVWDREFMGFVFGLTHWRHLLSGTKIPVQVRVDHANLSYYRHPQKINRRVARYINHLAEYNFELKHIAGVTNRADALSRRPDFDDGSDDNDQVTALPDHLFIRHLSTVSLWQKVAFAQDRDASSVQALAQSFPLTSANHHWWNAGRLVVVEDNALRREITSQYHDSPTQGHPADTITHISISQDYWWPKMKTFVQQYVKGCATCQANKADTTRIKPPLFPISPAHNATPFSTIAVDWITKLPMSQGYDSIMTITDHDVSKMAVFVPCRETQGAEEMAWLYIQHILPYYGLPDKVISDRDPSITSQWFADICTLLEVTKNTSTAYHPQTDGQSERTNQTLEVFLRIYCNHCQDDWAKYLPLAQFAINSRPSMTTKHAPFEVLMGFLPKGHQVFRQSQTGRLLSRLDHISQLRQEVELNIKHAQELAIKGSKFKPFTEGQEVWLDATHLKTTHPVTKLRPKP